MLQNLRDKLHGWPAVILFGAMALLLASFGLISYQSQSNATYVAKVGDHEISQTDFQNRMNDMRRQASATQGDRFDPTYFEKPEVKDKVLDAMIKQQLLLQVNDSLGLKVPVTQLKETIAKDPNFQVNGRFNRDAYSAILKANGLTAAMYEDRVRSSLQTQLFPDAVNASEVLTDSDMDAYLSLTYQTRDLRYVVLPRPALTDTTVSDSQIQDWYKQHASDYMTKEQVSISYIELDASSMDVNSAPSEADLKDRYEKEKSRFQQPAERLVSHILIDVPKNATPAQQKAALAKAESVYKQAEAGTDFAKLARKYSDDLGSKSQGGDLGWIQRGVTNKAFEDALFSMKKGQISKPVLSPEGYHIIDLRGVREGKIKPFSEVRGELVNELQQGAREHKYSELADKLTNKTYADPGSLEPAAQALGMKVQHTGLFSHAGAKDGVAANPKVVKAAFSDEVLAQGNNSNAIELGPNHIVVIHVDKHQPSRQEPLADVKGRIRASILAQRADAAAKAQAEQLLAKVRKGGDLAKTVGGLGVAVQPLLGAKRVQKGVPRALLDAAFRMPHPAKGKAEYASVDLGNGAGYALVALDGVQPGDLSAITKIQRNFLRERMREAYAIAEVKEFLDTVRKHTDVTIAKQRM